MSVDAYGPVAVKYRDGSIRVGYYDDDDGKAIVYFAEPPFLFDFAFERVSEKLLFPINTDILLQRRQELAGELSRPVQDMYAGRKPSLSFEERFDLLQEFAFVSSLLADRMMSARRREGRSDGRRVFISHSSTDNALAIAISVDIADAGHVPWLDEWDIKAGQSIPLRINEGIADSEFLLVLLSRVSVESGWVEAEWSTKYWDEASSRRAIVIPVLLEDCAIPTLLRPKKYADFRKDYQRGLDQVLEALT